MHEQTLHMYWQKEQVACIDANSSCTVHKIALFEKDALLHHQKTTNIVSSLFFLLLAVADCGALGREVAEVTTDHNDCVPFRDLNVKESLMFPYWPPRLPTLLWGRLMSERPHLRHSSWPLFHLTFPPQKHTHLTRPHPDDYHSPQHGPSSSPSPHLHHPPQSVISCQAPSGPRLFSASCSIRMQQAINAISAWGRPSATGDPQP